MVVPTIHGKEDKDSLGRVRAARCCLDRFLFWCGSGTVVMTLVVSQEWRLVVRVPCGERGEWRRAKSSAVIRARTVMVDPAVPHPFVSGAQIRQDTLCGFRMENAFVRLLRIQA